MYSRILVPVDGSPTAERGVDEAAALARLGGGRVRLVHVLDELAFTNGFETGTAYVGEVLPSMTAAGEGILRRARARVEAAGVDADTLLIEPGAVPLAALVALQARAWGADLIVIGTHGRRGIGRAMLGSDAEEILRSAPVPVLLVRAPDVSPAAPAPLPG